MDLIKQVEDFYEEYDEWNRLERHRMEFEITKKYLDKYIPLNSKVLDIGGGPGRYSIYLATKGHKVTLLDLVKKHIDIAKEKSVEHNVELENYVQGNGLNLIDYNLGIYNVVLLMGPLYHFVNIEDREKVVKDALTFLKPGGILIASFISAYAPLVDILKTNPEKLRDANQVLKYLKDGTNSSEEGFTSAYFIKPSEAKSFMSKFGLEELAFAGVEGLTATIEQKINELPQHIFEQYAQVMYELAEDVHAFANSLHYLYVGKKKGSDKS